MTARRFSFPLTRAESISAAMLALSLRGWRVRRDGKTWAARLACPIKRGAAWLQARVSARGEARIVNVAGRHAWTLSAEALAETAPGL